MNEFPLLPIFKQTVTIIDTRNNKNYKLESIETLNEILGSAEEIMAIPSWRTEEIYAIDSAELNPSNAMFVHVQEHDPKEAYLVLKDDEVYEMVYYKIHSESWLKLFKLTLRD